MAQTSSFRGSFLSGSNTTTSFDDPSLHSSIPHYHEPLAPALLDVGIFRDTLLPSFSLHASLSLAAYAAGRLTNTVETKDWLWPSAQVLNAWWTAVGRRVFQQGLSLSTVFRILSRPERLMLTGVTLWGSRLFYRMLSRSARRGWTDEPRYEEAKKEEGFWNKALFNTYLPEALFQSIICLPFTAPFRHQGAVLTGYHPVIQAVAVGVFSAGFAMEVLADWQLDEFKSDDSNEHSMLREGVWSIVRHPNYLGDTLVHLSFPLMLYGSDLLAPIEIAGSLANYAFLRYIGGDSNEVHQERRYRRSSSIKLADFERYRQEKNSFWPDFPQLQNQWTWIVLGCGLAGAAVEQIAHQVMMY